MCILCLYKILLKKYCVGLVEGVDLIFRRVCQISGQDNVVQIQKSHWQKVAVEIFVLIVCNRNFNNCAALLCENSTNSLKVETRELSFYRLSFYILSFYSF